MDKFVKGYIFVQPVIIPGIGYSEDMWAVVLDQSDFPWVIAGPSQSVSALFDALPDEKKKILKPSSLGGAVDESGKIEVHTFSLADAEYAELIDGQSVRAAIHDRGEPKEVVFAGI